VLEAGINSKKEPGILGYQCFGYLPGMFPRNPPVDAIAWEAAVESGLVTHRASRKEIPEFSGIASNEAIAQSATALSHRPRVPDSKCQ